MQSVVTTPRDPRGSFGSIGRGIVALGPAWSTAAGLWHHQPRASAHHHGAHNDSVQLSSSVQPGSRIRPLRHRGFSQITSVRRCLVRP
jgi:hypothetical protein